MNADFLFVAGLGRCGTSLAMQMIQRAGVPCVGDWPAFEVRDFLEPRGPVWFSEYGGHAMKWLDPHRIEARPPGRCEVLWLDRNLRNQAKSQIKFAQAFLPPDVRVKPPNVGKMFRSLVREREEALRTVTRSNATVVRMRFENLVDPTRGPREMADYLKSIGVAADPAQLAGALVGRVNGGDCQPGIAIEAYLAELAAAGAGPHG